MELFWWIFSIDFINPDAGTAFFGNSQEYGG